jgi:arginyl-tRNA synthetase
LAGITFFAEARSQILIESRFVSEKIQESLNRALVEAVKALYDVDLSEVTGQTPPQPKLGDVAFTVAFDLARKARTAPRKIAEALVPALETVEGVRKVEVAGAGYLNVYFDRSRYLAKFVSEAEVDRGREGKTIIEHTNINPNKAAHIGHLRNAALGDTFVRTLRYCRETVEVQNYIDDTGVQVADVVVGFRHLEGKGLEEVERLAESDRFDHYCWDLYARVSKYYAADPSHQIHRDETLKGIEQGEPPVATMAATIATHVVRAHLQTMERIGVRYDLLPWEGDILRLRFWNRAFDLLKETKAIRKAAEGKNAGCWVMDLPDESTTETADEKVIVRSNGTVTYVGKDIAYQLWKLGLLEMDFGYRPFHTYEDGTVVWSTTSEADEPGRPGEDRPRFGNGARVYNVIDCRQSYLQRIVQQGVALIASEQARERSHHFSYEMVALTPSTCRELGFPVSEEESRKPYLEVSGRRGLGVKADDLIEVLEKKAIAEVNKRNPDSSEREQNDLAEMIARGALRYFMIKYTKNKVIAFDFSEALSFEGDSGPYLQYALVRATKIIAKMGLGDAVDLPSPPDALNQSGIWESLPEEESDELWSLAYSATRLWQAAEQVRRTEEPAHMARFGRELGQKFNAFYHRYSILRESDPVKQALRLFVVQIYRRQMNRALGLMGIPVPERM